MNKLYAFGCSYTYGDNTSDWHKKQNQPSRTAWPNLLSEKLNLDCINLSKSGSSNDRILQTLLDNYKLIQDQDIIYIMMTFPDRKLTNKGDMHPSTKSHSDYFGSYHTQRLGNLNFIQNLSSFRDILTGKNFVITFADNRPFLEIAIHFPKLTLSKKNLTFSPGPGFYTMIDIVEGKHPDDSGHKQMSDFLFHSFN